MHVAQWPLFQRVPQGYVVGPALFTIYVNGCGQNLNASVNFYTDDTIIYCVLNLYSHSCVSSDCFWMQEKKLVYVKITETEAEVGLLFPKINRVSLSQQGKGSLLPPVNPSWITAIKFRWMPLLFLSISWTVYHRALRFTSSCKPLARHCTYILWLTGSHWPYAGWFIGIILSVNLCMVYSLLIYQSTHHANSLVIVCSLRILLQSPSVHTELRKKAFLFFCPIFVGYTIWHQLMSLVDFKRRTNDFVKSSLGTCSCFWHECVNVRQF